MSETSRALYWVTAVLLVIFGALTGFSIGLPFLALGLALVVLAPLRGRPGVFWPALAGVVAFLAGAVAVAPMTCTVEAVRVEEATVVGSDASGAQVGATTCTNLLGIDYSGTGDYDPPLWPAAVAGALLAGIAAVAVRWLVRERLDAGRST